MKPIDPTALGKPMSFGCLEAAKGSGRLSILLYTVCQTYTIKNQLTDAEMEQFGKSLGTT